MGRRGGQIELVAEDIGAFSNDELIFGTGGVGEGIVGLDDGAWRVARVQIARGIAGRGRQDTGYGVRRELYSGTRSTYNIATGYL